MPSAVSVSVFNVLPHQPRIEEQKTQKLHNCFVEKHTNIADKFFLGKLEGFGFLGSALNVLLAFIPRGIIAIKEYANRSEYGKEILAEEMVREAGLGDSSTTKQLVDDIKQLTSSELEQLEHDLTSFKFAIKENQQTLFQSTCDVTLFANLDGKIKVIDGQLCKEDSSGARTLVMSRQDFATYVIHHKLVNDLTGADLSGLDLTNLDMTYFVLEYANLKGTNFSASNLTGANLNGVECGTYQGEQTRFRNTTLDNATFYMNPKLEGVDFSDALVRNVHMSGVNCKGARFVGTNLSGTNLSNATLSNTDCTGATFDNATIDNTKVDGAQFARASGITPAMQQSVKNYSKNQGSADWKNCTLATNNSSLSPLIDADSYLMER